MPETEFPALGVHAGPLVVRQALHDAVFLARLDVRADGGVGGVAPGAAAERGVILLVDVVGEGVEDDGGVVGGAAVGEGAGPGRELRMDLGGLADGLGGGEADEGGDEEEGHFFWCCS